MREFAEREQLEIVPKWPAVAAAMAGRRRLRAPGNQPPPAVQPKSVRISFSNRSHEPLALRARVRGGAIRKHTNSIASGECPEPDRVPERSEWFPGVVLGK